MSLREFVRERRIWFLTWATGLVLLLQVFNFHSYVAQAVEHQAVVAATDDDASWNIEKTVKTRWWKDNGWVLYGPLYFRLNHSIQYLWQRTANPAPVGESEAWERTAHHSILTVSLLSLTALSLLIATALLRDWWTRFLFAFALNAAFVSNPNRAEFLVRAHPDHLLALFTVSSFFLTVLMFMEPKAIWRRLSACMWGFTVAVKMTVVICTPGFVLLFIPPFKKENWKNGLKYLGIMVLTYFLIGFPQTIVLDRPYRDLRMMNNITHRATLETLTHFFEVIWSQMWGPIAVIALACVFLGGKRIWPKLERHVWIRLTLFVIFPLLMLMKNKMLVPSDHYPIPFVGMIILLVAFAATKIPAICVDRHNWVRAAAFFAISLAIWGSTPETLQAALVKNLGCRTESRETYQTIIKFYEAGEKIWVDPYVPYFGRAEKSRLALSWEKTWKEQDREHFTVIGISDGYRKRYVASEIPDSYTTTEHPNWREVQEFYREFLNGDKATSPSGEVFKRVYANSCGHEVWKKE